ncbi:MAG TPA: cysteine--tRNA ligase [Acidimicrobiales bacterium]|nr:cysteine--tRNA ligase [Acidimicrobiales bacterium]
MLRIHDSAKGELVDFVPREPGKVSMYVCGPTVYAEPHLGHGRFALVWDVVRRYLEWRGFDVRFVSNITDIEDKIINRANEEGRPTEEVVDEYTASWYACIDRLGVRRPDADPRATGYVDRMVAYIADLVARGRAYVTPSGVYFSVESIEDYGLLARQSLQNLLVGGGDREIYGQQDKRNPLDFALWKFAKPGEPAWDSPWEPGRPGWHIECTVMSLDLLGDGFDIHGGGEDLRFPHHENERAQSVGGGHPFARYWVHSGMVVAAGGEKMSKSLGNSVSLPELLERIDPRAYRLLVVRAKYRSPLEVTEATLADAAGGLAKLDEFARNLPPAPDVESDPDVLDRFRDAMDDDFNMPTATAIVFDAVRAANSARDAGDVTRAAALAAAVHELLGVLGLDTPAAEADVDAWAAAKAAARDEARATKDWARADALRDELVAAGWKVDDTASGTRLSR